MGRPSKLSEREWAEAGRRLAMGDSYSKVAKDMKVGKSTLVGRFSDRMETIKTLATTLSETEAQIKTLPVSDQVSVRTLADSLSGLSQSMARTAVNNAKTAERLSEMAAEQVVKVVVPDVLTEESRDKLRLDLSLTSALINTGNRASSLGVSLLQANKDVNKGAGVATLEQLITGEKP